MAHFIGVCLIVLIVIADQFTKYLVIGSLPPGGSVDVTGFLKISHVTNTGVAFGMFQGVNILFIAVTLAVLFFLAFWYRKNKTLLSGAARFAVALIVAGAAGNLIDRAFRGNVVDFLDFGIGNLRWPSFNVADSSITIGGIILAYYLFVRNSKAQNTAGTREG